MSNKGKSNGKSVAKETVETYGATSKTRRVDRYWRRKGWKHNKRTDRRK